jgi:hypothetical protein
VIGDPAALPVPPPPADGAERAAPVRRTAALVRAARREDDLLAVEPWIRAALERVTRGTTKDPPSASRAYALVSVAMYDAAVAAWHWKRRYDRRGPGVEDPLVEPDPGPSYPSERAAIAGAAARVLGYVFRDYPAGRWELMAREAAGVRVAAGASFRSDEEAGLRLGHRVADAVVERARSDGSARRWHGRPPRARGVWRPPPGSLARPAQPLAGRWRTRVLRSGAQFRPPPPPAYGSPEFLAEAQEVLDVSRRLTPRERRIATYWASGQGTTLPPGFWNEVALEYARGADLSGPRAARVFALLNVALADAAVASWDAKYAYWSARPVNAIRDLGLDRDWKPLLPTPTFPSYVSGHSTFSAAAAEVLAHLFPDAADRVRAKAREAGLSRILGGIHFKADNVEGLRLGRRIGSLVVQRARRDGADA